MSQTCPRCRLINPDEASRCDCGYDFATGTLATSYLHADLAAKHGGAANLYRAQSRRDLAKGIAAMGFVLVLSVIGYLSTGRLGIATIPTFGAVIWFLRAHRFHRQSRAARDAERGTPR